MADSRIKKISMLSLEKIVEERSKLEELKTCTPKEIHKKGGSILPHAVSESASSTKKEFSITSWFSSLWQLSFFNYFRSGNQELLPVTKGILQTILFPYIEDDDYTQTELAKHPQFSFIFSILKSQHTALLNYVVCDEQKETKSILENFPKLLLEKGMVTDRLGHKIRGTALQIALDIENIEMLEILAIYFKKLPDGQAKERAQYQEKSPDIILKFNSIKQNMDFTIALEESSLQMEDEIDKFRKIEDEFQRKREELRSTNIEEVKGGIGSYSIFNTQRNKNIREFCEQLRRWDNSNKELIQTLKGRNPHLALEINALADKLESSVAKPDDSLAFYQRLEELQTISFNLDCDHELDNDNDSQSLSMGF